MNKKTYSLQLPLYLTVEKAAKEMLEVMPESGGGAHGRWIICRGRWIEGNRPNGRGRREEKRERENLTSSIFLFGIGRFFPNNYLVRDSLLKLHKFGIRRL